MGRSLESVSARIRPARLHQVARAVATTPPPATTIPMCGDLLAHRTWSSGQRGDGAEMSLCLTVGAGSKEERIRARAATPSERQCPEPIDHERLVVAVLELAKEFTTVAECIDVPIAEVTDEDPAAE